MNSFIFKNIDSKTKKVLVNELPSITKAPQRVETIEIEGYDGDISIPLGYQAYRKDIEITTYPDTDYDDLFNWLNGSGDLVLSNEPNKYYKARLTNAVELERVLRHRKGKVGFIVQPFKYALDENLESVISGATVVNAGTLESLPYIKITGTGQTVLTVNSKNFTLNVETSLIIDSTNHLVLDNSLVHDGTRMIATEFPKLNVGENVISWTGSFTVEMRKNTRWL